MPTNGPILSSDYLPTDKILIPGPLHQIPELYANVPIAKRKHKSKRKRKKEFN